MKKISAYKLVLFFLLSIIIILLIFFSTTYSTFQLTISESIQDSINLKRMRNYEQLLMNLSRLESNERGFLITNNPAFITDAESQIAACENSLDELSGLNNSDTAYSRNFLKLRELTISKINFVKAQIDLMKQGRQIEAVNNVKALTGLRLMNGVRTQCLRMEEEGREMLRVSANEKRIFAEKANHRFIILGVIAMLAFAYFFLQIRYELRRRLDAEQKLAHFNADLSRQVQEQTKAIRNNEMVYRNVVEQAADGIIVANPSLYFIDVNTSACNMMGYTKEELLSQTLNGLMEAENNAVPFWLKAIKNDETILQDFRIKQKNAGVLPVEISARRLPNGNLLATIRDITNRKEREEKQKIREKQLQLFVENSPVAEAMFDVDMNYIAVSRRWIADNRLEGVDIIGKNHYEIVPYIPQRWKEVHQRCLAGNAEKNEMDRFEHPDGTVDWLHWEVNPWYTDEGKIGGIFMYTELLNDKLEMEATLREKEQQYTQLIDRLTDGFIRLDKNWVYKYANKKIGEMTHYDPEYLVGKNVWSLFPAAVGSATYQVMHEVMETQQYGHNIDYYPELDLWQENYVYPAGDGIYVFIRDVSEAKRAERKLAASERKIRQVLSSASESFYVVDKDYHITLISDFAKENMKKAWQADVTVGTRLTDIIPAQTNEPIRENLQKALSGQAVAYEFKRSYEGLSPWVEVSYMPVKDEEGTIVGVYIATKDITARKTAEEEMRMEKQLSDSIINSLPGIFYLYDQPGNFLRWNKNFEAVSGYSAQEIQTMRPLDFFEGEEKELLATKINEVFEKGKSEVEASFYTKQKQKTPYYFTGLRVVFEGKPCLIGMGLDITERKKAEKEIIAANQRFKLIAMATNDFVWDNYIEEGTIWWNDSYYSALGWKREINAPAADTWEKHLHPNDKERVLRELNKILYKSFKTVWTDEYRFEKSDGTYLNVLDRGYILRKPDGTPYRMLGSMTDITGLKEVEAELRLSEQKYKTLFSSNPMPLWMYSLEDLRFIDVNEAAVLHYGYSRDEFLQMTIKDIRPPAEQVRLEQYLSAANKNGIIAAGHWQHIKKDGTIITVDMFQHDTVYDGRQVRLVLAIDVTEKVKAEEALEKSNQDIRRLAKHLEEVREEERTGIAREIHDELGQQLTVLKMDISWLSKKMEKQDVKVEERFREMIQVIDDTVKTVRRISSELRPSVLDNLGIIAAIEWQSGEFENRTGIKTNFNTDSTQLELPVKTANAVFRIFQESLTNIARHAGATKVDVLLNLQDNKLFLTIRDNGKGFDMEKIAEKKTLGILGMKERTLLINGEYNIKSKPGAGTTITLVIPVGTTIE